MPESIIKQVYDLFPKKAIMLEEKKVVKVIFNGKDDDERPLNIVYTFTMDGSLLDEDQPNKPWCEATIRKFNQTISAWSVKIPHNPTAEDIRNTILSDIRMEN